MCKSWWCHPLRVQLPSGITIPRHVQLTRTVQWPSSMHDLSHVDHTLFLQISNAVCARVCRYLVTWTTRKPQVHVSPQSTHIKHQRNACILFSTAVVILCKVLTLWLTSDLHNIQQLTLFLYCELSLDRGTNLQSLSHSLVKVPYPNMFRCFPYDVFVH